MSPRRIDGQVLSALGLSLPPLSRRPKKPSSLEFFLLKRAAFSGCPGPSYTSLQGFLRVHLLVVSLKRQPGSHLRPLAAPGPPYTFLQGFLIVHLLVVSPKCQAGSHLIPSAPG